MIILDPEDDQLPKLAVDTAAIPTRRTADHFPQQIPSRPRSPVLPDYETSEAQQQIFQKLRGKSRKSSKFCRGVLYAIILYVGLFVVVGLPLIFLVSNPITLYRFAFWLQYTRTLTADMAAPTTPSNPPL